MNQGINWSVVAEPKILVVIFFAMLNTTDINTIHHPSEGTRSKSMSKMSNFVFKFNRCWGFVVHCQCQERFSSSVAVGGKGSSRKCVIIIGQLVSAAAFQTQQLPHSRSTLNQLPNPPSSCTSSPTNPSWITTTQLPVWTCLLSGWAV